MGREPGSYEVSAEFYDLLQAEDDRRRAERRFGHAARRATRGVLDVGAGSGIVTQVLLAASAVPVHAVEPSPAMRSLLLSRLAATRADRRARVTVHPHPLQEAGLEQVADLAVASNVVACLDPTTRREFWKHVGTALTPGGLLLFDPPPAAPPAAREHVGTLGPVRVGPDHYYAELHQGPGDGTVRTEFAYRVEREGRVLRREHETFELWPAAPALIAEELALAGLRPIRWSRSDLVAARRD
ncbi:class I SAM-dependent methyltransferase [Kitasatospora sp. NPDC096147]|uniref:class I SAM-dependent methyltransferase n=1 Tax=Kitasatospora sp. NPDC096147 TaxID=3364093 RepID=UPI00380CE608